MGCGSRKHTERFFIADINEFSVVWSIAEFYNAGTLEDVIRKAQKLEVGGSRNTVLYFTGSSKEAILQKKGRQEYHLAQARLARAINRLKVKRHYNDSAGEGM